MGSKTAVIVVSYNTRQDTLECLRSVYAIDCPDLEAIVVDNGSADGSAEAVRSAFPAAVVIGNKANTGFCAAANLGIRTAKERGAGYLLILNSDTAVEPSIIRELKSVVDADSSIGAVSPVVMHYGRPDTIQFKGAAIDWGNGETFDKHKGEALPERAVLDRELIIWCAIFMRADVIDAVGYLDERFFLYYEDIDWSVRCRKAGLRTVVYVRALVRHKGSISSGGSYLPGFYFYYWRNRLLLIRKHAPLARKIQFSVNYAADCAKKYAELSARGKVESADAAADGLWSALTGNFYGLRERMPSRIRGKSGLFNRVYLFCRTLGAVLRNGDAPDRRRGDA